MATRLAVVCPVLVAVLMLASTHEVRAARPGGAFVDLFANDTETPLLTGPKLYAQKSFDLELAGASETTLLKCLSNQYLTKAFSGDCKPTYSKNVYLTDCNTGTERYALYVDDQQTEYCFFKQVEGNYKGYYLSAAYTYLNVRNSDTVYYEGFKCDPEAILNGKSFTLEWTGGYAFNGDLVYEDSCDKYQYIKQFQNRGAIPLVATLIRDFAE